MNLRLNRRHFLQYTGLAAAATAFPLTAKAISPNGKLRTAHIGVAGMGLSDLNSLKSHPLLEVAALCDVDADRLKHMESQHPDAKTYQDFRLMISELGDSIDAVVVSTPDHTHAPASMTALNAGKPVYCQKPLTHDAFEARQLSKISQAKGLPTQMGIQIHSYPQYRRALAIIQSGAIGKVSEVRAWCGKSWGYDGGPFENTSPPPANLDWNLWLGTAAERPFVPNVYHPGNWRSLIDFGTGTLGDMGVHIFDTPYDALQLTAPNWVLTTCRAPTGVGHPTSMKVEFEFPGTKFTTDKVLCTWTDGSTGIPKAEEVGLPADFKVPGNASLFIGEEGMLLLPHIAEAKLFPEVKFKDYKAPEIQTQDHYHQWVDACLGKTKVSAPFSYGGPLTEALLIGVIGSQFPGEKLEWNAEKMEVTNHAAANQLLRRKYRSGFEVTNL